MRTILVVADQGRIPESTVAHNCWRKGLVVWRCSQGIHITGEEANDARAYMVRVLRIVGFVLLEPYAERRDLCESVQERISIAGVA